MFVFDIFKKHYRLALVSFVILFAELLLIRLIGTEIRIFAYLSNLTLLAIFVGSGAGMLMRRRFSLRVSAALLLLLTLVTKAGWLRGITDMLSPLNQNTIWFQQGGGSFGGVVLGLLLTTFLFFLVLFIFVPLGQSLGGLFENSRQIVFSYSLNVVFSILGMWAFYGMSVLAISPYIGVVAVGAAFIVLAENRTHKIFAALALVLTAAVSLGARDLSGGALKTVWSPYQKLSLYQYPPGDTTHSGYLLNVNGVTYMGLYDFSDARRARIEGQVKELTVPAGYDVRFADQYRLPYQLKAGVRDALIVGAGGGNDVAAAVRARVPSIDAVEIDPEIVAVGRQYHPEKPYASPAVNVIIDDGRSFFRKTDKKYDLVIMGLADSHTLSSSYTNIRLDHYLYTAESFAEIKKILKPDGILYLSFEVKNDSIGGKIEKSLREVFGHEPVVFEHRDTTFFGLGGVMFITSPRAGAVEELLGQNPDLKTYIAERTIHYEGDEKALTDDWPYLYLDAPRIPAIHLWVSIFLIAAFLFLRKTVVWQGNFRWDMFALGGGFLLYEFQNVSKTSLLFGSTWTTNLFTISAILALILLANFVQAKRPLPLPAAYVGLALAFAAQFLVPLEIFNTLPFYAKALASSLFLNLPLFFSAVIFITLFRDAREKSAALASNLIGSAAGGLLEALSFLLGIQSLLLVALAFYLISAPLVLRRQS